MELKIMLSEANPTQTRITCFISFMEAVGGGKRIRKSNTGVNKIKIHNMHMWKYHKETPYFVELINTNKISRNLLQKYCQCPSVMSPRKIFWPNTSSFYVYTLCFPKKKRHR
jgi:hypothetical protein